MATSQTRSGDDVFDHVTGDDPTEEAHEVAQKYSGLREVRRVAWMSTSGEVRIKTDSVARTMDVMADTSDISRYTVTVEERNDWCTYLRIDIPE